MKYDPSKIMYDQSAAVAATKLFDDVAALASSKLDTVAVVTKIREINPDPVVVLDTINMTLGWLTFPKETDTQKQKVSYRSVIDLLSQYLAGVD